MFSCHKKISSLTNSGPERRRSCGEVLDAQNCQGEWTPSLLAYRLLYLNGCSGKGKTTKSKHIGCTPYFHRSALQRWADARRHLSALPVLRFWRQAPHATYTSDPDLLYTVRKAWIHSCCCIPPLRGGTWLGTGRAGDSWVSPARPRPRPKN